VAGMDMREKCLESFMNLGAREPANL